MKTKHRWKMMRKWSFLTLGCLLGVLNPLTHEPVEATSLGGPSHIGTFEGSTTFTTSSSNGINPGLYLEVMDEYGNYTEYTSEDGVITIPNTMEGAYVTQAKLLGKTKYRDQDTGELLDEWEAGRNLTLESVQMPVLTTAGKNLWDNKVFENCPIATINSDGSVTLNGTLNHHWMFDYTLDKGTYVSSAIGNDNGYIHLFWGGGDEFFQKQIPFTISEKVTRQGYIASGTYENINVKLQLEEGTQSTPYEPFKLNILSASEDVELRGIGDVQDTLDLLTGEVTDRVGEIVLDGSQNFDIQFNTNSQQPNTAFVQYIDSRFEKGEAISCDLLKAKGDLWGVSSYDNQFVFNYLYYSENNKKIQVLIPYSMLKSIDVGGVKQFLAENPIKIFFPIKESIKTVALNSTYHFKPVDTREILVEGSILPLICSVTTPTTPLSFVLNPNAEEGQRFIAPEFTIRNQTPSAVSVELKQFTQTSNVLNDVPPTKYENWNHLNKNESKDIALALVPLASDGWESLLEGPRYVKDNSNYRLGTIKAESSVDFTFEALHGRAFTQALDPQYRLVLVFDF